MRDFRRRDVLRCVGAAGIAAALPWGCAKKAPVRETVLRSLVEELVVPDVREALVLSEKLEEATGRLAASGSASSLETARASWKNAVLHWKQVSCFRSGPTVETGALLRVLFWPLRPASLEALVRGSRVIDDEEVHHLGVDEKGLFAIEHLLFRAPTDAERSYRLAHVLARGVTASAGMATRALGDGRAYAAAFSANGQESISRLANQLIAPIATVTNGGLAGLLGAQGPLRGDEVEGMTSGMVVPIMRCLIASVERLYLGKPGTTYEGVGVLVRATAPAIDSSARASFSKARSTMAALEGVPIEAVLGQRRPSLQAAAQAAKDLEVALKVDVPSALGVTLLFNGSDAD